MTSSVKRGVSCRRWLQTEYLKKETERLHIAAQDQTLATKANMVTNLKQQGSKKRRMCHERDETVILNECPKRAQLSTRNTMIRLPLWFTGNYVEDMVLNMPNTGMHTEWKR